MSISKRKWKTKAPSARRRRISWISKSDCDRIRGHSIPSGSSHAFDAVARVSERGSLTLIVDTESKEYLISEYDIEPRLGNANRVIRFADGVRFELGDHEAMAALEGVLPSSNMLRFVDWMESRWPVALGSIVGVVVFVFLFFEYGMPLTAKHIAFEVPQSVRRALSENWSSNDRTVWVVREIFYAYARVRGIRLCAGIESRV